MTRVLVTGASGFVGRAAVEALRSRGYEVHAASRHDGDLLDPSAIEALVRAADASHLLHLAWTTEHGAFWADPANLAWSSATLRLFDSFADAGGVRSVMAGSCAQYDWDLSGPADERATPRRPATLYGIAKESTSRLLAAWSPTRGLSHATALLFFPYGPFDNDRRLVPSIARDLLAGRTAAVRNGAEVRDFVHVDDCGAALAALLDSDVTGDVNVGTGKGSSIAEVAATVARIVGREELLRIAPPSAGTTVVASVRRSRDEVGFLASYDLDTGIRQTIEWLSERGADSRRATRSAEASR